MSPQEEIAALRTSLAEAEAKGEVVLELLRETYDHPNIGWCCCGSGECLATRIRRALEPSP